MGRLSRLASGAYFDEAVAALEALPGVQSVGVAHVMPLDFGGSRTTIGTPVTRQRPTKTWN